MEPLKTGVLDLIQAVAAVEDGDQWIVVCDDCECGQAQLIGRYGTS